MSLIKRYLNNPRISIVIVNWNTIDLLNKCLQSIYLETNSDLIEIIVIDNGSKDGSGKMVKERFPQVRLIENSENVGFAKANNQGFEISSGEFILMLNSDTEILDKAIEKTLEFADNHPDIGIVGCKLFYPDRSFQNSCFRFPGLISIFFEGSYLAQIFKNNFLFNRDRYGNQDIKWNEPKNVDCLMGSFMFIRHSVLTEIGYLDLNYFMYCEEVDLAFRVKKAGWKVVYFPKAQIIHVSGGSQKSWEDIAWSYKAINRGIFYFLKKWRPITAYIGNCMFTLFLIPRIFFWAIADLIISIKQKESFKKMRLYKASTFWFHLKAIIKPSLLGEKWGREI